MQIMTTDDIMKLISAGAEPCISIYMPTHRRGPEVEQDPIRFKNMVKRVEDQLEAKGKRKAEIDSLLAPARKLLEDGRYWRHQSDGLAVFIGPEGFREYRLPLSFDELAVVSDRYHTKPVLSLLHGDGRFYLLVLSYKNARLYQGTSQSIDQIDLADVPQSVADIFDPDRYQSQIQFHTGAPSHGNVNRDAISHGAGSSEIENKDLARKFFALLDNGIREIVNDERAPLVLAGVDYLLPIYRDASKYPTIMDDGVSGSHDETPVEELHQSAWKVVAPHFRTGQEKAFARWQELFNAGNENAVGTVEDAVKAAAFGRVDTLFLAPNKYCWGRYNPENGEVEVHQRDEIGNRDLLDFAAMKVITQGGTVYTVDADKLPKGSPIAGLLRF